MRRVRFGMTKKLLLTALAGVVLLAGCGSVNSAGDSAAGGDGAAPAAPQRDALAYDGANGAAAEELKAQGVEATAGPVEGRSVIYRGDISVKVDNVESAANQVAAIATTAGGFVSEEKRNTDSLESIAWVTVRIPSKQFHDVLGRIAELGEEGSRAITTEDVTEAVVDLDTRIAAARASVETVRAMYSKAKTLTELVSLERELSQRQADLAALEAKKRRLDDLVSLSTITVQLAGPNTVFEVPEEPNPSFVGGLSTGWDAFVTTVQVVSAVFGFLLPFLLALAIPVTAAVFWAKRRRRA